jgi:DNA-binding winged helix-turn-helix (wHTH) protein
MTVPIRETFCFGDSELDLGAYELHRAGLPLKLGLQQMDLLILLIERRTQLASRAEIIERLWKRDVFVDVDTDINSAISKIRQALGDSVDVPRFVETVPAKGYRFIADVVVRDHPPPPTATSNASDPPASPRGCWSQWLLASGTGIALVCAVAAASVTWRHVSADDPPSRVAIAVLPVQHLRDPATEYLAEGLTAETCASLAQIDPERISARGRSLAYKATRKAATEIGRELAAARSGAMGTESGVPLFC